MKLTNEQVDEFLNVTNNWVTQNPTDSPFKYAISKIQKQINKINKPYLENFRIRIEDAQIDSYAVDAKTGYFDLDKNGKRQQTPDAAKILNKRIAKIKEELESELKGVEYDIEPYFATTIPDNLTSQEKETFQGILINNS